MTALPPDAIAALKRGSKIDAIKCVRLAHGLGLKEAKDSVEAYAQAHPAALRSNLPGSSANHPATGGGSFCCSRRPCSAIWPSPADEPREPDRRPRNAR